LWISCFINFSSLTTVGLWWTCTGFSKVWVCFCCFTLTGTWMMIFLLRPLPMKFEKHFQPFRMKFSFVTHASVSATITQKITKSEISWNQHADGRLDDNRELFNHNSPLVSIPFLIISLGMMETLNLPALTSTTDGLVVIEIQHNCKLKYERLFLPALSDCVGFHPSEICSKQVGASRN
jgi:hypothetical protein